MPSLWYPGMGWNIIHLPRLFNHILSFRLRNLKPHTTRYAAYSFMGFSVLPFFAVVVALIHLEVKYTCKLGNS